MIRTFVIISLSLLLVDFGCREKILPPPVQDIRKWNVVPELATLDVRYMIQHNDVLYLTAVDPNVKDTCISSGNCYYVGDRSVVYKTTDAVTWTKIKGFKITIGPMTFHDDTLYCLGDDSIYTMLPNGVWRTAFATPPRLAYAPAIGDIVFIRDTLYGMQTVFGNAMETYRIHPDGTYEEVAGPDGLYHYAGSKYIKKESNGSEVVYVRPIYGLYGSRNFFSFDGYTYTHIENGLTDNDIFGGSDAMAIKNDTLYAGFGAMKAAGNIKIFINGQWKQVYDTIPYWRLAYSVTPVLRAEPTAITFWGEKIYVATNSTGVIEWEDNSGWVQLSNGLIHGFIPNIDNKELYYPVPFLKCLNNKLIVAYGKPGYGPWGGVGVYTYDLK